MRRTAKIIDGKAIAAALRVAIKSDVQELTAKHGRVSVCAALHVCQAPFYYHLLCVCVLNGLLLVRVD